VSKLDNPSVGYKKYRAGFIKLLRSVACLPSLTVREMQMYGNHVSEKKVIRGNGTKNENCVRGEIKKDHPECFLSFGEGQFVFPFSVSKYND
jgi:hypothetical protein